jgi:hypothetical protein
MKAKQQKFNFGEALQVTGGAVGAGFLSKIIAKQQKLAKFADFAPIVAGFGVAYFAPKYASVGYGMIGAGAVSLVAKRFPMNGGRLIAYPETVTGEEINAMPFQPMKIKLSPALIQRMQLRGEVSPERGGAFVQSSMPNMGRSIVSDHFGLDEVEETECFDGM